MGETRQVELVWPSGERCFAHLTDNAPESITVSGIPDDYQVLTVLPYEIRALDGICLGVVSGSGEIKLLPKVNSGVIDTGIGWA